MSPRHNRPRRKGLAAESEDSGPIRPASEQIEGDWLVRSLAGTAEGKVYRCPGCDQEIPGNAPHIVAWRLDDDASARRHWHTPCWRSRGQRTPNIQRGRTAPRYG